MLGIGQITTRIAELIRGALPYAIVNNDPNASRFARLVAYTTVQQAVDANHMWIKVAPGEYPGFTADVANMVIEGSWDSFINGGTTSHGITITANGVVIRGLKIGTTAGGGNNYDAISIGNSAAEGQIIGCYIPDCDRYAIEIGSACVYWQIMYNKVDGADDSGMYADSTNGTLFLGNQIDAVGGYGMQVGHDACCVGNRVGGGANHGFYGDGKTRPVVVGNRAETSANDLQFASATDVLIVANLYGGTIATSGSSGTITANENY